MEEISMAIPFFCSYETDAPQVGQIFEIKKEKWVVSEILELEEPTREDHLRAGKCKLVRSSH